MASLKTMLIVLVPSFTLCLMSLVVLTLLTTGGDKTVNDREVVSVTLGAPWTATVTAISPVSPAWARLGVQVKRPELGLIAAPAESAGAQAVDECHALIRVSGRHLNVEGRTRRDGLGRNRVDRHRTLGGRSLLDRDPRRELGGFKRVAARVQQGRGGGDELAHRDRRRRTGT